MDDQEIREAFLRQLGEDRARIANAWEVLRLEGWSAENAGALIQAAHRLSGAALSVGYGEIGHAARRLETALKDAATGPDWAALERMAADVERAAGARRADRSSFEQEMEQSIKNVPSLQETRATHMIYIVEDDPIQAESLVAQLNFFGYAARVFMRPGDLGDGLRRGMPTAVLMDIIFPEGELAGTEEILKLREEYGDELAVFFLSVREDTLARIKAIRAGGRGYFTKPVDIAALVDELDKLVVRVDPQPYRVLIVDDSEVQAKANAMHLRKARMETGIVTRALDVLKMLEDFAPDLLLLDVYMPECSGLELAQMIRQIKGFTGLPIVYLSAEMDRDKQLAAVGQGGDDFLTKPIRPDHLVSAVTARIERYRQMRALMLRDSLTGLFNHTTVRELLAQEVTQAARRNQALCVAMIDIDHFKRVNDIYGHATGDKVLRSLSHMLTHRLRRSDIVGRYGGEEFFVILPNSELMAAWLLMDELRTAFAQIVHVSDGSEFLVTFSCGVAAFPEYGSPSTLSEAADKAMYEAKQKGRNRVVRAE
ncbi:MAG: diguanylate cyclase [Chloroflexota bacterium]